MRFGAALLGIPALLAAVPVPAQDGLPADAGIEHLHLPGYEAESERAAGRSSVRLDIAPELVSHNPLGTGSETTDALDLTLAFRTRQPLGERLELALSLGAAKTIDNGSSSELAASAELRTRPGDSGFSTFARYNIAREFTDFFDEGEATEHRVTAGVRFGRQVGAAGIGLQFAPRWHEASGTANDHGALNLWGEVVVPVVSDQVHLVATAAAERRWYEHRDPVLLVARRDWRFASYLGLDLAGLIDTPQRWVHDLGVGVEWLEVSSNVPAAETSELSLLPAFSIGVTF